MWYIDLETNVCGVMETSGKVPVIICLIYSCALTHVLMFQILCFSLLLFLLKVLVIYFINDEKNQIHFIPVGLSLDSFSLMEICWYAYGVYSRQLVGVIL